MRINCLLVTTQPQSACDPERGEQRSSLSPHCCILGGRAFGPPLCRGCAPATPPYKTIPHRPCALIPAVPLQQPGCRQPNTQSDCLNRGSDKELVKTGTVYGLVVTPVDRLWPVNRLLSVDLAAGVRDFNLNLPANLPLDRVQQRVRPQIRQIITNAAHLLGQCLRQPAIKCHVLHIDDDGANFLIRKQ